MTDNEKVHDVESKLAFVADQAEHARAEIEGAMRNGTMMQTDDGRQFVGMTPEALGRVAGALDSSRDVLRFLAGVASQPLATETVQ